MDYPNLHKKHPDFKEWFEKQPNEDTPSPKSFTRNDIDHEWIREIVEELLLDAWEDGYQHGHGKGYKEGYDTCTEEERETSYTSVPFKQVEKKPKGE